MTQTSVETKDSLLQNFLSKDSQQIWSATWAVIKTRDKETLSFLCDRIVVIESAVEGIELGGRIGRNRDNFEFAMKKLRFFRNNDGCLCELYPGNLQYDPKKEAAAGNVSILSETAPPQYPEYECECKICRARYHVKEGDYHFTYWEWKKSKEASI